MKNYGGSGWIANGWACGCGFAVKSFNEREVVEMGILHLRSAHNRLVAPSEMRKSLKSDKVIGWEK